MKVSKIFLIIPIFCYACGDPCIYEIHKPFEDIDIVCRFNELEGLNEHSQYDFRLFKVFRQKTIPKVFRIPFFKNEDDIWPSYCVNFVGNEKKSVAIFYGYIDCLRITFLMEFDHANFTANRFCLIADSQDFRCLIWDAGNIDVKIEKEMEFKLYLMDYGLNDYIGIPANLEIKLSLSDFLLKKIR